MWVKNALEVRKSEKLHALFESGVNWIIHRALIDRQCHCARLKFIYSISQPR